MSAFALVGTLVLCGVTPANSAPSCRQLEAELARASVPGKAGQAKKYDDAIARQRDQIARARQRASASGCSFSIFARKGSQCGELNETIKRMTQNLQSLQNTRAGMGKKGGGRTDRKRILAALDANGCRAKKAPATASVRNAPPLASDDTDSRANAGVVIRGTGSSSIYYPANRPYRTQCVRTCDGYFFPMSKSTSPADFQRDQNRCEAACPGTRVEMFYSQGKGEDTAAMISAVTGKRYADLPRALFFRRLDVPTEPGCSCGGSMAAQATSFAGEAVPPPVRISTKPGSSVSAMEASRRSGGQNETAEKPVETAEREADGDRKIRVVGPTFLPDR
ncbi:DUF2865 domain-containing protein [Aquamicrobium sp. NLF2-7]|uniref:DUF2865 domain-containing protein n=1 Tax=Aquamicrobium sp. NLF2-7 TaxID=2918753 RepID=UPI001EFC056D|nr:DUF2865 domain-containing protein [Aquamicrobium sp. NLF2-7]MCG8270237.1 DUF2865 domain-containing protein [Aquamicrobium sp. NLF2-7]